MVPGVFANPVMVGRAYWWGIPRFGDTAHLFPGVLPVIAFINLMQVMFWNLIRGRARGSRG